MHAPSGRIYAKDFFGAVHITGNNFVKEITGLKPVSNNAFGVLLTNEWWLCEENTAVYIIRDDTLHRSVDNPGPGESYLFKDPHSERILSFRQYPTYIMLHEFKQGQWRFYKKIATGNIPIVPRHLIFVTKDHLALGVLLPDKKVQIHTIDTIQGRTRHVKTFPPQSNPISPFLYDKDWKEKKLLKNSFAAFFVSRMGKTFTERNLNPFSNEAAFIYCGSYPDSACIFSYNNGFYEYLVTSPTGIKPNTIPFETKDKINNAIQNPYYNYLTVLTGNKPLRVFPYIKKYPAVFNNDHSNNIFALAQDNGGRIWAGSYQHHLSIIPGTSPLPGQRVAELKKQPYAFMNAALNYNGKMYFVGETNNGGILEYDMRGNMRQLQPNIYTGYFLYLTPNGNTVYYASAEGPSYPVYYCDAKELRKPFIKWNRLDSAQGIEPFGMATMTQDTSGRIWMGHPKKGFAVYNPATKKAISYDVKNNKSPIGFISSITDKKGTVWMGSDDKGLWYYNDYSKPAAPQNIHNLNHPLLNNVKRITAMAIYNEWLILGCYDKICLLNLDSFYLKNKTTIRYLNHQETAFTSFTEQNTMLTSKTDSTIWFSTSDMLYQWDIKSWLKLPTYKVTVNTFLTHDSNRIELKPVHNIKLTAGSNSFDIGFEYLSPDCLPRYTRTAFARQGDSVLFSNINTQSLFSYKNMQPGRYRFYLEVFEQDGTTTLHQYNFIISSYYWQQWWFWVIVSLLLLTPFMLWLDTLRKKALHQKKISQLNIVTLSNQFRPHFILNALNTIGADLKNKPEAEQVISRLGESINLIFRHSQQEKVSHALHNEWLLVKNVIEIQKAMYIPNLYVKIRGMQLLKVYKDFEVPLGILEINVENALLHGLRNKKFPPYYLCIEVTADNNYLYFLILDNGVGRTKAMQLSSHKNHGSGTKNLNKLIELLNSFNRNKIEMSFSDLNDSAENTGTIVKIKIPKNFRSDH